MDYDFDTPLSLRGAHTTKYDGIKKVFGIDDLDMIPMFVADMDYKAAPPILEALQREVDRGFFGYFSDTAEIDEAVVSWYARRHGWDIEAGAIRYTHGVVNAFGDVLAAFSEPGDGIIVFTPVYHAFFRQAKAMEREIVESPLSIEDGRFVMDIEGLRRQLTGREKILVLCSPHNPGGRLWSEEEIQEVADFCGEHGLILISDEIHMDLTFPGVEFTPTAVAAPNIVSKLVVLTAASKAFNTAGGETGLIICPDRELRVKLDRVILDREGSPNRFGMLMIKAAFGESEDWNDAVRPYIAENFRIFAERMNALPGVSVMDMEATYLSWVDFSALGMGDRELLDRVLAAKVAPSPGTQFGTGGAGHLRFNVALPRPVLLEAIARLEEAFADLQ